MDPIARSERSTFRQDPLGKTDQIVGQMTRVSHTTVSGFTLKTTVETTAAVRLVTRFHGEEENGSDSLGSPIKDKTEECCLVEAWKEYAAKLSSNPEPFVKFRRINIAMATLERKFLRWKARRTC